MHRFYPFYGGPGMRWGCGGLPMGLAFLVVVGLVIYFIMKSIREKKSEIVTKEETPLEILKRRYAKGEINQEEFKKMSKELKG